MNDDEDNGLLCRILVQESLCTSYEEAIAVVEAIREDNTECDDKNMMRVLLQEYLGASEQVVDSILEKLEQSRLSSLNESESESDEEDDDNDAHKSGVVETGGESDDDDVVVGPGECALCERHMQLSRHHMIPKSTWSRLESRLLNMASKDCDTAAHTGGGDTEQNVGMLDHLVPQIRAAASVQGNKKRVTVAAVREVLPQQTVDICRPCHSQIHRTHDNLTLARQYNTPARLLADPTIYEFAKWASQQRVGKYGSSVKIVHGKNRNVLK
jgi:hypothetical protein